MLHALLLLTLAPAEAAAHEASLTARYADVAERIIRAVKEENHAFAKLTELCDDIGPRLSGSENLERAVAWALKTLEADGHENVRSEPVTVPKWVRGDESLAMIEPRSAAIPLLGLGGSVGTPPEGITARVVVVTSDEQLEQRADEIAGNIVLFNVPMSREREEEGYGYGSAVRYRVHGARLAAQHGAVAALVRSVTTRSLQSPHTGGMSYTGGQERIPSAAVSIEFADQMQRYDARGIPVRVTLKMEARMEGTAESANVLAELRGRERPDEVVVIGGHLDSWDVGQGAHDDGGGCVTAMEALNVLRRLDLRPRRTIRVVLFTNEENGLAGGRAYAREHADELPMHAAAIESDSGVFAPRGYALELADTKVELPSGEALETDVERGLGQLGEIVELLEPLGSLSAYGGYSGADIRPMRRAGVPLLGHDVDMTHYFDIHHTHADTLDKVDPDELTRNVAAMAVTAYILADMPERFAMKAASDTE